MRPVSFQKAVVSKHSIEGQTVYFDALVDCVMSGKPVTMVVDAYFSLKEGFGTVHTRGACPAWKGYRPEAVLPDDLVPVISGKELDPLALRMISSLYPRSSDYAVPVIVNQAARRLGLTVLDVHFDDDREILGKIFFEDASVPVTDPETGITNMLPVSAGTILVNTPAGGITDERVRNNTVLHECVHWMLHRPAFLLAGAWDRKNTAVACRRAGSACVPGPWTAIGRMERQANALAPRMLMPGWATRFIADGWLRRYRCASPIFRMEKTIDHLSRHFNVSRQLARIRMEELGYEDAKLVFSCYDRRNHTISFENAARELAQNRSFRDALESGIYAYIDSCFVIRDRKYVYRDESGTLHLTTYAKAHMAECCLAFAARRVSREIRDGMLRYNAEDEAFISGSETTPADLAKRANRIAGILQGLPASFSETLVAHMKRKSMTIEQLAESSLVSDRQRYRFRSTLYPNISLPQAVALCIGLKLHPILAMDLIKKAGYSFNMSPQHNVYQMLILTMSNSSIYECNEFLAGAGLKPIGKEE